MKSKNEFQELHEIFIARGKQEPSCINCGRKVIDSFYKKSNSKKYICVCSLNVSPLSATPFEKTRIELRICFKILNDVLISEEGIDAKWVEKRYGIKNTSAWEILYKVKDWLNLAEEKNGCAKLSGFVKVSENYREKFVLKFNQDFSPNQMKRIMLNALPPLFVKNAA